MKKLFLVGNGPLPCEEGIRTQTAFGLRTWQFLSSLQSFSGKIRLVLITEKSAYEKSQEFFSPTKKTLFGKEVEVFYVEKISGIFQKTVAKLFHNFSPDMCAGINLGGAYALAQLSPKIPFWADLNGWSGGEAQSQAYVYQDDAYIPEIWKKERAVLETADKISVVSTPQKYITIGQLATLGRISHKTEYHDFVSVVPNANEVQKIRPHPRAGGDPELKKESEKIPEKKISPDRKMNSSSLDNGSEGGFAQKMRNIPENAFIVFFSGAYNTWLDEKSLFEGLELAMKKNPEIYFVSTGSGVSGFSNKIFDQFISRIEKSKYKDRFVFLGWLLKEELVDCYSQVDVAINLDRKNLESEVGARNRINEWIVYGVPVLSTVMSEISQELFAHDALVPVKVENPKDLADQIERASKMDLTPLAQRAKDLAEKNYSYEKTIKAFADFLKNGAISPDKGNWISMRSSVLKRVFFRIKSDGIGGVLEMVLKKLGIRK